MLMEISDPPFVCIVNKLSFWGLRQSCCTGEKDEVAKHKQLQTHERGIVKQNILSFEHLNLSH